MDREKLSVSKDVDDVFYDKKTSKYMSYLSLKERRHFIGKYDTFDEAKKARKAAAEKIIEECKA